MKKIRVGAVSYLNTRPMLLGFPRTGILADIELVEDFPARVAQMLIDDQVDIGLVPVAIIPQLKEYHIDTDYCIGTEGEVASVCIFSQVPMEQIEKVLLDYQSRTSAMLTQILLREYWKKDVIIEHAEGEDYLDQINGTTAALVIGDRALEQRSHAKFIYDLGTAWKAHTGLPFVFATWISNKKLPQEFIQKFNEANQYGVDHLEEVIAPNHIDYYDLDHYYRNNISYVLDDEKRKGMELFIKKVREF